MNQKKANGSSGYLILMGTVVAGLTSFVIWLLRISERDAVQEKPTMSYQQNASRDNRERLAGQAASAAGVERGSDQVRETLGGTATTQMKEHPAIAPPEPLTAAGVQSTAPVSAGSLALQPSMAGAGPSWTVATRYIAAVGLVLGFFWLVYYSRATLTLLIFAALIAILVQPLALWLNRRLRLSIGLSIVIVYLMVAGFLFVAPILVVPNLISAINSLLSFDWNALLQRVADYFSQRVAQSAGVPLIGGGLANSVQALADTMHELQSKAPSDVIVGITPASLISRLGQAMGLFVGILGPLVSGFLSLLFMVLISLRMSFAGGQMRGWIMVLVPPRYQTEIGLLLDRILNVWNSFLRGQFVLMVAMGVLVWLMNWLLGTPQAMLLGFLAGLLEVIPSLGPILATIPAAILALVFGSQRFTELDPFLFMLIVILAYVAINALENQFLVPRILGGAVDLPAVAVLSGVMIGGATAGIVGVFLATPMMATGREIVLFVYSKIAESPREAPPEEGKRSFGDQVKTFGRRALSIFQRKTLAKSIEHPTADV